MTRDTLASFEEIQVEKLALSRQVVALKGGLGNQLFQYSYAQYLARQGWRVNLDLSCVRHGIPAIFEIPLIGDQARQMVLPVTRFIPSPSGRLSLLGRVSRKVMRPGRIVLDESVQGPEPSASATPSWWFGYWQRLSYAEAVIPLLRTGLDPALPCETTDENRTVRARVHVRRGDYAGNRSELPAEWYQRALDMVYELGGDAVETEVVTDSPEWCEQNLDLGRKFKVVPPTGTPLDHLRYLAAADFVVISRSTFSWWAAAISDATVIAPDPWFPKMSRGETQNILPGTWLSCATS
jgi:hypothetical protein